MKAKEAVRTSDAVDRVYGVVPRPRSYDAPEAWPRRNALGGKGSKWREYYGYRYRPEAPGAKEGAKFSDAQVAAAMVAHSEIGGRIVALTQEQRLAEEGVAPVPMRRVRSATPRPRGTNGVDYHVGPLPAKEPEPVIEPTAAEHFAASEAIILRKPEPIAEPVEVPAAVVAVPVGPVVMPIASQDLRYTAAAEVLRELAASYGPRRAHKLVAMADFVEAHGKRAVA